MVDNPDAGIVGTFDSEDTGIVLPAALYGQVPPPTNPDGSLALPPTANNFPLRRALDLMAAQIDLKQFATNNGIREYMVDPDSWYAEAGPGTVPSNSVRISRFATRQDPDGGPGDRQQLEFNFGGARLFQKGQAAFMSDYNGLWALSAIQQRQEDGSTAYVPNHRAPNVATDLFPSVEPVFNFGWTSNHLVRGKVFYTGCDTWNAGLDMWQGGGDCASTNAIPVGPVAGAMLPLVGEDADENDPQVCSAAPSTAGPLTRNQTVMHAAMRPGIHAEVVSAVKGPTYDPPNNLDPSTFVININNGTTTDRSVWLILESGESMRFDKQTELTPLTKIEVDVPRGSSNARTVFDYGNPADLSSVVLTVCETDPGNNPCDPDYVLAKVPLQRDSLAPLENVQNNFCFPNPDFDPDDENETDPPLICNDPIDLLVQEFFELILKREIATTTQLLELQNLDFENTTALLDFENLDLQNTSETNLDLENQLVFLDFQNLELQNLELENDLYANLDLQNDQVVLDLQNLELQNRLMFLDLQNLELENAVLTMLDFQNLDLQNLEFQNLDFQNLEFQNLEFENLEFENLEFQNESIFASDVENLDLQNLELQNTTLVDEGDPYTELTWTADSGNNAIAGVDIQPVLANQLADVLAPVDENGDPVPTDAALLLTVRKAYMTPTVPINTSDPNYCEAKIVVQNQLVYAAILTPEQINAARYDGTVEDPPPNQAHTPGFFINPDESLIVSYRFFNVPSGVNTIVNSGVMMPTQAADATFCDQETPTSEFNFSCEFDFEPDETPPVISLNGPAVLPHEAGTPYVEAATASDDRDGDLTSEIVVTGSVNPDVIGDYDLSYNVSDAASNDAIEVMRTVQVRDTLLPAFVDDPLLDVTGVQATGPSGAIVAYAPPTASDSFDTDVSVACTPPPGTVFELGESTVTCTATDDSGNSVTDTFTVTVVDTIPPVLTIPAGAGAEATGPGGAAVTFSPIPSATDTVDTSVPVTCTAFDPPMTVGDGSTFPIGSWLVTCTASDDSGNPVMGQFWVTVGDNTGPVITLLGANLQVIEAGDAYVDPGATAFDLVDGDVSGDIVIDTSAVDTMTAGSYSVTFNVSDSRDNPADQETRTVVVDDDTPPTIVVPDPPGLEFFADSFAGIVVDYSAQVSVSDNANPAPTLTCSPLSGTTFVLGVTPVTCNATDASGNTASASFDVTVLLNDGGGVGGGGRNIKAGSSKPLGWSWENSLGNIILLTSDTQQLKVFSGSCSTIQATPEEDLADLVVHFTFPGSSGLQLLADNSWQVNWQTVDEITGEDLPGGDYCARADLVVPGSDPVVVIQSQYSATMTIR
jgi:uncharacterized protein YjbI with pentapeptide repeats